MMFALRKYYFLSIFILLLFACQNSSPDVVNEEEEDEVVNEDPAEPTSFFYAGADISYYPRIAQKNLSFKNRAGVPSDFLQILKENGINTIRLRLWHTPTDDHASFDEVRSFSAQLKSLGFKVWITVHYSDSWADPSKQFTPNAWQNASFSVMKDSVYNYTTRIMSQINPDIIQVGNEIDNGFLWPIGNMDTNQHQFLDLLREGIRAVRDHNTETKIMIHKADPNDAVSFFNIVKILDFDLIGISYYPQWHGKDLVVLRNQLHQLNNSFLQDLVIAETAYPFTHGWNDQNNNIIGSNDQIIFPQYPATLDGQKNFLSEIKSIVKSLNKGVGFGYWGAEWVAFEGPSATAEGSPWENQALFDFDLKATPAIEVFKDE